VKRRLLNERSSISPVWKLERNFKDNSARHAPNSPFQAHRGQVLLNRFQLSHPLGQGGMGEVWRAHDRELDLDIAIKLLHPALASAPAQVEFLKNECRLARRLNHPHIVPVYDFHHDGDAVFISMAWVDGLSFDRWNKTKERPWEDRLRPLGSAAGPWLTSTGRA
jgi:serine/threonine protein kinase